MHTHKQSCDEEEHWPMYTTELRQDSCNTVLSLSYHTCSINHLMHTRFACRPIYALESDPTSLLASSSSAQAGPVHMTSSLHYYLHLADLSASSP